jgi:hypothetical protein
MIGLYVKSGNATALARRVLRLSDSGLAPERYGPDEDGTGAVPVGNMSEFDAFAAGNPLGYCLFAKRCHYEVAAWDPKAEFHTVFAYFAKSWPTEEEALALFSCGHDLLEFGFACHCDEYLHRHELKTSTFQGVLQSQIGLDLGKYVPGLYWRTLISHEILRRHGLDFSSLEAGQIDSSFSEGHVLLKFGVSAESWREQAKLVDGLCAKHEGIFDIGPVRKAARWVWTLNGNSRLVDRWP